MNRKVWAIISAVLFGAASPCFAQAAAPAHSVWDGVYSAAQAKRGAAIAASACSACHGQTLTESAGEAPPLAGPDFLSEWTSYTAEDLFKKMNETMPQTAPGSLSRQQYIDILAQILNLNKFPAGNTELGTDDATLKQILILDKKP